ncbi:MAG: hypothetical protein ACRCYY_19510 [Trueperaceae bacterium]
MTFAMNSLWFEIALITSIYALGQIFFAAFTTDMPKWKRVTKIIVSILLACTISAVFGRVWFFILMGVL